MKLIQMEFGKKSIEKPSFFNGFHQLSFLLHIVGVFTSFLFNSGLHKFLSDNIDFSALGFPCSATIFCSFPSGAPTFCSVFSPFSPKYQSSRMGLVFTPPSPTSKRYAIGAFGAKAKCPEKLSNTKSASQLGCRIFTAVLLDHVFGEQGPHSPDIHQHSFRA